MRWLWLDEVVSVEKGKIARTKSRVPKTEVTPEFLMIEMMAQTGGLLVGAESDFQNDLIFAKIESAEFSGSYEPGDAIEITATSENLRPEGAWIDGQIAKNRETIASGKLLLMNVGNLQPGQSGSLTFHSGFMNHFQVREKIR